MRIFKGMARTWPQVGIRESDACRHDLVVTSAGGGIQRRSCRLCHSVSVEPNGWTPTDAKVRRRRTQT